MCLLAVLHRAHPEGPLVAAANRDEQLLRPAVAMTMLRSAGPRILGGRDELAGGTWLAVNEHGMVAGLTNRPAAGRDPSLRSRGELPLALAAHADARAAVEAFRATFSPRDYNPCWLLVGDRRELFYVEMTGGAAPRVTGLGPGLYILENRPLAAPSPKVDHLRAALAPVDGMRGEDLQGLLHDVLRSHEVPGGAATGEPGPGNGPDSGDGADPGGGPAPGVPARPPQTLAACVHAGAYGTRTAATIVVPAAGGPPRVRYSTGPPCVTPMLDAGSFWRTTPDSGVTPPDEA